MMVYPLEMVIFPLFLVGMLPKFNFGKLLPSVFASFISLVPEPPLFFLLYCSPLVGFPEVEGSIFGNPM